MTHDQTESFCQFVTKTQYYQANNGFYPPPDCQCDLIAKVREDMLAKCIAVIEAMPTICDDLDWPFLDLTVPEIISEIKATLQSEQ